MKPKDKILSLIDCLPQKDMVLVGKFIDNKDYESVREIVDSDIYLTEKAIRNQADNMYSTLNIKKMRQLKYAVDSYCSLLNLDCIYEETE